MRINEGDEEVLLALKDGPKSLKEIRILVGNRPRLAKRKTQKFLKYGLIKRIRQGIYGLDSKGKRYIEKLSLSDKALSIGEDLWDKVSAFIIDKVPTDVYQAVVRLTLSEMRAKQSEIFTNFKNQFTAGWSGVLLAGKPKAIKTPIGELICIIVGLDPEEHKFPITGTKGEFGVAYQEEGGVWKYRPSPWHKKPIVIIDDWHRIIRKDTRETALSLAHGSRTFKRYEQTFTRHSVPFMVFNTHTKTVPETIEKIIKEIGEEYVKRLVVVNVDYIHPYLEDAAILTRKMLRSIPKLNFKAFPVRKKELTDTEFTLLCEVLKAATDPDKREFFDERSVELLVLGRYALARNRDIIGTIYQTCWDRLLCLETLEVTKENWRSSFRKRWKKSIAIEQPKILEEVKKEEEREEEREEEIKKTKEKTIQQKAEQLRKRRSFEKSRDFLIARLKDLRDNLSRDKRWQNKLFPFRKDIKRLVREIGGIRDPEKLKQYELIYPEVENEQKQLLEEIKEIEDKEKRLKEKYEALKKAFIAYARLTGGMGKDHNQQNERCLESLFSQMGEAKDTDALTSITSKIEREIENVNTWIEEKQEEIKRKEEEEEEKQKIVKKEQEAQKIQEKDEKQAYKEQTQIQGEINKLQNGKRKLEEQLNKNIFRKDYLSSQEKNQFDTLQNYLERKKTPTDDITSLLKNLGLIKWVNFYNKTKKETFYSEGADLIVAISSLFTKELKNGYSKLKNRSGYLGIDNKEYSPFYFYHNWDGALSLIQIRINQIRNTAMQKRKNKLTEEWERLDKKEQNLKPPLNYIRTDKCLIRARNYLGEKEDGLLHFKVEDGGMWIWKLPKGKKWTVQTKIDYGGELLTLTSDKGPTIVVQTDEGEREISKDRVFSYIYEHKGPEPTKQL